ncbi:MAG: MSHA biogenesis protein MshJ [Flavobacteriales bacterium]|jgi:MSHA biogenesis protein MshJ
MWEKYSALFDERNIRERIIIAVCSLAVIFLAWDFFYFQAAVKKQKTLDGRFKITQTVMTKLNAQEKVFSSALTSDKNTVKQREIRQYQAELVKLDSELNELSVGLISPGKLPQVLRDLLLHDNTLSLLAMTTLPPQAVSLGNEESELLQAEAKEEADTEPHGTSEVYRHAVKLRVLGRYQDVYSYLKKLESLPWKFYWSELDYSVFDYPKAEVTIEVYTLSAGRGMIGA